MNSLGPRWSICSRVQAPLSLRKTLTSLQCMKFNLTQPDGRIVVLSRWKWTVADTIYYTVLAATQRGRQQACCKGKEAERTGLGRFTSGKMTVLGPTSSTSLSYLLYSLLSARGIWSCHSENVLRPTRKQTEDKGLVMTDAKRFYVFL